MMHTRTLGCSLTAGLLSLVATGAQAQADYSAQGVLDFSYGRFETSGAIREHRFNSNSMTASFVGVTAKYGMEGGWTPGVTLESFLRFQDLSIGRNSNDPFFSRNAFFSLASPYGSVRIGRLQSYLFDSTVRFNAMGNSVGFSPAIRHIFFSGNLEGVQGDFYWNRAISYSTPNYEGITGNLMYSQGQTRARGDRSAASLIVSKGLFGASLSVQRVHRDDGIIDPVSENTWQVGATYNFGFVRVFGLYTQTRDHGLDVRGELTSGGVEVPIGPGKLQTQFGRATAEGPAVARKHTSISAAYLYPYDSVTDFYVVGMDDRVRGQTRGTSFAAGVGSGSDEMPSRRTARRRSVRFKIDLGSHRAFHFRTTLPYFSIPEAGLERLISTAVLGSPFVTDPKKIAEIDSRTWPNSRAREGSSVPEQEWDDLSLPLGSRVGEFEITGIIGKGGFGIVYLAWDHSLERVVALKEYMPTSLASRKNRIQVNPLSERYRDTFQIGLKSFVNEAKLLAQFHNPSLVEVYRFWEGNGTAYMAMPYYKGLTLGDTIRSFSGPPSETWLMDLLGPLTEALMELHSVQCYHRDIAPDNILILAETGSPLLLDFGAARRVIAGQPHALTVILKTGYAPIEQYGAVPGMQQGPWTDVYALASVVYWAITGQTPPAATSRMIRDPYVPLADCAPPQYSQSFVTAIDRALVALPEGRTESITKLRSELGLSPITPREASTTIRWSDSDATVVMVPRTISKDPKQSSEAKERPGAPESNDAPTPPTEVAPPAPRLRVLPLSVGVGAAAVLITVAAGVWLFVSNSDVPRRPDEISKPSPSPPPPSPSPPRPAPKVAESIPIPQSASDALELILSKKDPTLGVHVDIGAPRMQGRAVRRSVSYTSSEPGHLYLIGVHTGDEERLTLLLPGPGFSPARVPTSGKVEPPFSALKPGIWKFAFVVARQPLDLRSYGWVTEDTAWERGFSGKISPDKRAQLPWAVSQCAPGILKCESAYGAAAFALKIDAAPGVDVAKPAPPKPTIPPVRKPEPATHSSRSDVERTPSKRAKAEVDPECARILQRLSLGESDQKLIDRMKILECDN